MNITTKQLKKMIKEELETVMDGPIDDPEKAFVIQFANIFGLSSEQIEAMDDRTVSDMALQIRQVFQDKGEDPPALNKPAPGVDPRWDTSG
jgi:hypothetical protein